MAAEAEDNKNKKKKLKRDNNSPMLLVHDRVEVRSIDEGFMGSWHSGVVISHKNRAREVQYDFLLSDDGSQKLIEQIDVHPVFDGITPIGTIRLFHRGLIRPVPPPLDFYRMSVHHGQCVDAYYQEAWWEGVVFDHEKDSEFRSIFFPDIGDLLQISVDNLRISQDWDEFSQEWNPRGNWLFLELIEQIKQERLIHVSVREIWYEVREKNGFEKLKEWTNFSTRSEVWTSLVMEVIDEHSKLAAEVFYREVNLDEINLIKINLVVPLTKSNSVEEDRRLEVSLSSSLNSNTHLEGFLSSLYDGSSRLQDSNQTRDGSDSFASDKPIEKKNHAECFMLKDLDMDSKGSLSDRKRKRKWKIAGTDMVPEAEFCPDSVSKYRKRSKYKHLDKGSLKLNLRKHLAYLGWKIEFCQEEGFSRMRYTSPEGRSYMSLVTACKDWHMVRNSSTSTGRGKNRKTYAHPPPCNALISCPPHDTVEPANIPEAVKFYANSLGSKGEKKNTAWPRYFSPMELRYEAKRHLRASGWSMLTNVAGKRKALCYTSPSGRTCISLARACKAYIDGEIESGMEATLLSKPRQNVDVSKETKKKSRVGNRLSSNISIELGQAAVEEHHNEGANVGASSLSSNSLAQREGKKTAYSEKKKEKKQHAIAKVRDDVNGKKGPRQLDPSSSFHSPLTVLSWLIDNDVVLLWAKVYYLGENICSPKKEGLITREGIKCNCCKIIFSLRKFQAHAGSTHEHERPAANIYLEDGRSLLSCQSQLRNRYGIKNMLTPPPQPKSMKTNDYICSICHFGGLLVMCDQCPSSFHCECLGLKDIPDGEWFCPQCCCRSCGSNNFNQVTKSSILSCYQCEDRYHMGCLLKQGNANTDSNREEKWFCNKKCEQIFLGLQKLLGKPVVVGDGNLTWTLLKYIPRYVDLDGYGTEPSVEIYSKLKLAASVIHECFEPIHAPGTKKDIVEDVIFSKGSDLSRLNFEGFYTVLLSRDDEVITVAAVRVHGGKVAEVPLVGTRFQYRKLGMCRFLMNELEKKLMELGVERLVLPAATSVLSTWTTSLGFSKVTESEKSNLGGYIFLDFQGAVMCQKLLIASVQPIRTQQNIHDDVGGSTDITSDKNSKKPELFPHEQTTEVEPVHQGTAKNIVAAGATCGNGTSPLVLRVNKQIFEKVKQLKMLVEEGGGEGFKEIDNSKQSGIFRCYKRRRVLSAC